MRPLKIVGGRSRKLTCIPRQMWLQQVTRWGLSVQLSATDADLCAGQRAASRMNGCATLTRATFCYARLQDERLQDAMEELRGRFKAVVAAMGLHEGYFPKDAGGGMAF